MPGLIVSIAVAEGDEVQEGQTLATVEAMKMENILRAEGKGKVAKINAKAGESLAVDAVIMDSVCLKPIGNASAVTVSQWTGLTGYLTL